MLHTTVQCSRIFHPYSGESEKKWSHMFTNVFICQRGCPSQPYFLCAVINIITEKKKKHYLKNFFIFFLFVHLPFHSFRVCGLQTLWSSSGLLSIKMKTSLSLFIPLLYFLSALLVCVIKIAAYQAKMDSDSYPLWLVQTTNCL